jgi:hypothetical protein
MADIEMVDIENPDNGSGVDGFVKAQPDRRIFLSLREKYGMPPNDNPNPDGVVAATEPRQHSRYAFLCFAVFVALLATTAIITFTYLCMLLQPTTSVGRALQFTGVVVGSICMIVLTAGLMFVCHLTEEMIDGNPEGRRTIDLLM